MVVRTAPEILDGEMFNGDLVAFRDFVGTLITADYRKHIPSWLEILTCAKNLKLVDDFGRAVGESEVADEVYLICVNYWLGKFFEDLIKEQTEPLPEELLKYPQNRMPERVGKVLRKRGSMRDTRSEKIAEKKAGGKPTAYTTKNEKIADAILVVSCDRLLVRMKAGSNEKWAWKNYYKQVRSETNPRAGVKDQDHRDVRRPSTGQKFVERVLKIIDPNRSELPKPGFYWDIAQRYQLHSA